jgi:rod shape determining protein RodA
MIRRSVPPPDDDAADSPLRRIFAFLGSLDKTQLGSALLLCAVGLLFIHSTGIQAGRGAAEFWRQFFWLAVGMSAYILCSLPDPRRSRSRILAFFVYPAVILLLILVLIPKVGIRLNGASRWLGFGSLRIQPSEFAKLGLILALSALFSGMMFDVNRPSGITTAVILTLIPFLLIVVEPDLGSALVCLPIFIAVVLCAGLKWRYIVSGAFAVALIGSLFVLNETSGSRPLLTRYQRARITTFLNPEQDRAGAGFNAHQAKLAVGSGGLTGKGVGEGTQNTLGFLPRSVANNDFIFSVIAEETGFFGSLALISIYAMLLYSILRTAFVTDEIFGRSLCVGVAALLFTHMFINIGMNIGVLPVTGLPLPLVSRGGSFTVVALASLGMVQSVHRHRK